MRDFSPENTTGPDRADSDLQSDPSARDLFWREAWNNAPASSQHEKEQLPVTLAFSQWSFPNEFDAKKLLAEKFSPRPAEVDPLKDALKPRPEDSDKLFVINGSDRGFNRGKVSQPFLEKTEKAFNDLPDDMKKWIKESKLKLTATEKIFSPSEAKSTYSPHHSELLVSEKELGNKDVSQVSESAYLMLGYAFAEKSYRTYNDTEFRDSVIKDIKWATREEKDRFNEIFKRGKDQGYYDLFAETFSLRLLERTGYQINEDLIKLYPNTMAYMRRKHPNK